ncbi:NETI motif-containing protein [Bacillus timonensis]|nr:NETI motif-containing protein [Bacillus timonensis]
MVNKPSKKKFEVGPNETIGDCLDRMKAEGYMPVRRIEEPIFQEVKVDNQIEVEPCGRKIVFEGRIQ